MGYQYQSALVLHEAVIQINKIFLWMNHEEAGSYGHPKGQDFAFVMDTFKEKEEISMMVSVYRDMKLSILEMKGH